MTLTAGVGAATAAAAGGHDGDVPVGVADQVEGLLRLAAAACRRRAIALGIARHDSRVAYSELDTAEYRKAAGLPAKRRRDFVLGRQALRSAVAELGRSAADAAGSAAPTAVGAAAADRYRLPPGFTGSVSHSGGLAVAVTARTGHYRCVGIDLELGELPAQAAHLVLRPQERRLLTESAFGRPLSLLGLFSAKEAAYKAFSPLIPELPAVLRAVRVEADRGALVAWPEQRPGLRVRVNVSSLGPHGVLCWTGVPAREANA